MPVESHLAELQRRHQALKDQIAETNTHPGTDDLQVNELKRRKLQIKDEISRLRNDRQLH